MDTWLKKFNTEVASRDISRLRSVEKHYTQQVTEHPDVADHWHILALIAQHTGRTKAAIDRSQRAVSPSPTVLKFQQTAGDLLRTIGRWNDATNAYGSAAKLARGDYTADLKLGQCHLTVRDGELAAPALRKAVALKPNHGPAWFALGQARWTPLAPTSTSR